MYNSQYYTCEQIDERLLQGYLDDYNTQTGQSLTKAQFLTKLGSLFSKEGVIDNTATQIGYYECDTAAGTAAKAITVANYALFAGGSMKVKFANKNTANNATLNINSQGAKALYYQGERASATNSWDANEVVEIYYDGTSYYANNVKGGSGSGVYDVSKEHPTSGPNSDGKFTLEYILNPSNVNELIPVNKRYPGMSIQFVSTSDNKYVQARCIADEFTTDVTKWQSENVDNEPTRGSINIAGSDGVYNHLDYLGTALDMVPISVRIGSFKNYGKIRNIGNDRYYLIPVSSGQKVKIKTNPTYQTHACVCKSDNHAVVGEFLDMSTATGFTDRLTISANTEVEYTMPSDAQFIGIEVVFNNLDFKPVLISIDGYDILKGAIGVLENQDANLNKKIEETAFNINQQINYSDAAIGKPQFDIRIGSFDTDGKIRNISNDRYYFIPIVAGQEVKIKANPSYNTNLCVCKSDNHAVVGGTVDLSVDPAFDERLTIPAGEESTYTMPSDAQYIAIVVVFNDLDFKPETIKINGYDFLKANIGIIEEVVFPMLEERDGSFENYGKIRNVGNDKYYFIPITAGQNVTIETSSVGQTFMCVCKSDNHAEVGEYLDLSTATGFTDRIAITVSSKSSFIMPSDAQYIAVVYYFNNASLMLKEISVDYMNLIQNLKDNVRDISKQLSGYTLWSGTQAQYDAITVKDPNTIYFIL